MNRDPRLPDWQLEHADQVAAMVGRVATSVQQIPASNEDRRYCSDGLEFKFADGTRAVLQHQQDCCENVDLKEIVGDLQDLVGAPLLMAEVVTQAGDEEDTTWSFYKFATVRGYVTATWFGSSNGYYSEEVDIHWGLQE